MVGRGVTTASLSECIKSGKTGRLQGFLPMIGFSDDAELFNSEDAGADDG
jgi:hypothetical protein